MTSDAKTVLEFLQSDEDRKKSIESIEVRGATVSDLTLDFTLPGTEIELKEGGKDLSVDIDNVEEYVELVIDWTLRRGVEDQVLAFKQGFSTGESDRVMDLAACISLIQTRLLPQSSPFEIFKLSLLPKWFSSPARSTEKIGLSTHSSTQRKPIMDSRWIVESYKTCSASCQNSIPMNEELGFPSRLVLNAFRSVDSLLSNLHSLSFVKMEVIELCRVV